MKRKYVLILVPVIVISLLLGGAYLYQMSTRNAIETLVNKGQMINILLAGSNTFNNRYHRFYAILSLNPDNRRLGVTYLPPDFRVMMSSRRDRALPIKKVSMDDFDLIRQSIRDTLKLQVPFYIELYAPDVERFVDIAGGVNQFVFGQVEGEYFRPYRENYLNGYKVMKYINTAPGGSIYIKYDRVQDILSTLFYDKKEKMGVLNRDFIEKISGSVRTNLLTQESLRLARLVMQSDRIISVIPPGDMQEGTYVVDDIAFRLYESEFLTPLVIDKAPALAPKIRILNGTRIPGLARRMRNSLIRDGVSVVEFSTAPYQEMKQTVIINREGDAGAAFRVSELTGIEKIYHIVDTSRMNNVLMIIGEDMSR